MIAFGIGTIGLIITVCVIGIIVIVMKKYVFDMEEDEEEARKK